MSHAEDLYDDAVALLAKKDRSSGELTRLLAHKSDDPGTVHEVISRLGEERLLDDRRLAEYLADKAVRKQHGPTRIRQTLRQRGVDEPLIEDVIGALDADWLEMAAATRRKLFSDTAPLDQLQRAKLARKLVYQGHWTDVIREVCED